MLEKTLNHQVNKQTTDHCNAVSVSHSERVPPRPGPPAVLGRPPPDVAQPPAVQRLRLRVRHGPPLELLGIILQERNQERRSEGISAALPPGRAARGKSPSAVRQIRSAVLQDDRPVQKQHRG